MPRGSVVSLLSYRSLLSTLLWNSTLLGSGDQACLSYGCQGLEISLQTAEGKSGSPGMGYDWYETLPPLKTMGIGLLDSTIGIEGTRQLDNR